MTKGRLAGTIVAYAGLIALVGAVMLGVRAVIKPPIDWFVFDVLDP